MNELYTKYGITDFNFEDDNFILRNKAGVEKIGDLCGEIRELHFKPTFSIFCRPDAVSEPLFADLRDAGMTLVYLGLESVHSPDLEFFHKGLTVSQIYEALDTLISLGYSLEVGDGLRVKIGFIAWHPLTTLMSLRDAVNFIRRYALPPKIIRRKLLLYSGIPIKSQIRQLGLLDTTSVNGWRYKDEWLVHLEQAIDDYIQLTVCRPYRDRIRTVEKALRRYRHADVPEGLIHLQQQMDQLCLTFVEDLLDSVDGRSPDRIADFVEEFSASRKRGFKEFIDNYAVDEQIVEGFALAGLPESAVDAFRK